MVDHTPVTQAGDYGISKSLLLDLTKIRAPFDDIPVENAYTGKKLELDWTLHLISDNNRTGYDGALFSAEIDGRPHYFIYHQGANNIKDFPSIARLANGKPPQQTDEALRFTDQAMRYIAERHPGERDIPTAHVGYSIGGAMAILACRDGQPVIAFDPPGTRRLVEAQGRNPKQLGKRVLEVLSPHANAINAYGRHIGSVIEAGPAYWQTEKVSTGDFIRMTVDSHRLRTLGIGLAEMDDFTAVPANEAKRTSESFDAFRDYLSDHMGKNPTWRERALSVTAAVMDTLWLDKLGTRIAVAGADRIATRFSKGLAEQSTAEQSRRPSTHPDVRHHVPQQAATMEKQPERSPEPPAKNHAADILAAREKVAATERHL